MGSLILNNQLITFAADCSTDEGMSILNSLPNVTNAFMKQFGIMCALGTAISSTARVIFIF
jgi:hypothetical protein